MTNRDVEILVFGAPDGTQFSTTSFQAAKPSSSANETPIWGGLGDLFSILTDLSTRSHARSVGFMGDRWFLRFAKPTGRTQHFATFSVDTQNDLGWKNESVESALRHADVLVAPERDTHPPDAPHLVTSNENEFTRVHGPEILAIVEEAVRHATPEISPFLTQVIVDRCHIPVDSIVIKTEFLRELVDWTRQILTSVDLDGTEVDTQLRNDLVALLINGYLQNAKHFRGVTVGTLDTVRRQLLPCPVRAEAVYAKYHERKASSETPPGTASESIHIAVAFDRGYVPHAAVTIQSALEASVDPSRFHFHVLQSGDLDDNVQAQLNQLVETRGASIQFYRVCANELAWLPLNRDHISVASYYRLTMHRALPTSIGRVVYIDCDTVVTDDISKLWELSIDGCIVGGCPDEGGQRQSLRLGLAPDHRYFNAGVMIFDLAQIRKMDLESEVQSIYRRFGQLITLQDQDLLNLAFLGNCRELPLRWNANTRLFVPNELEPAYSSAEADEAARDPGILHFTDRRKPWHDNSLNPMGEIYWDVRSRTLWPERQLDRLRRLFIRRLRHRFSRSQRDLDRLLAELQRNSN